MEVTDSLHSTTQVDFGENKQNPTGPAFEYGVSIFTILFLSKNLENRLIRTSSSFDYFLLILTRLNSVKLLPNICESKKKAPVFPGSDTEMASKIVFHKEFSGYRTVHLKEGESAIYCKH